MIHMARAFEGTQNWGAEGILYRVMKLKSSIVSKGRESGNIISQKNIQFGHFVSDTCSNYLSCTKCSW